MQTEALRTFTEEGLLIRTQGLSDADMQVVLSQMDGLPTQSGSTAFESDGVTPRAVHGSYVGNAVFGRLVRLPQLAGVARQLLASEVYVYQFKINLKVAFTGEGWPWHQDYSYWQREDGMPQPRALTAAIFLDEVTDFNGPMYFIPRSHRSGCLDAPAEKGVTAEGGGWQRNFSSRLPYQTGRDHVARLVLQFGIHAARGPRGTIVFFDSNIVHCSPSNVSPMTRRIIFITYNSVANAPQSFSRPEFLVSRNATGLVPLESESLCVPLGA